MTTFAERVWAYLSTPVLLFTACLLAAFFMQLFIVISKHSTMFAKRHGRRHASVGLLYLFWLMLGFVDVMSRSPILNFVLYDSVLGILGVVLTLTAAMEFQHKNIKNEASGTLEEHATVTYNEMIEHSFYQGLNLVQILYLHSLNGEFGDFERISMVLVATSPWLLRGYFPVNRFSDNYKSKDKAMTLIGILYRTKKYQYVFYKHFLLHGLNISVAISGDVIGNRSYFRMYWVLLNASYVMEFFLQTLVKKKYMQQATMLHLQQVLMLASTLAALQVLRHVYFIVATISLLLNFANRKRDVLNTALVLLLAVGYKRLYA